MTWEVFFFILGTGIVIGAFLVIYFFQHQNPYKNDDIDDIDEDTELGKWEEKKRKQK